MDNHPSQLIFTALKNIPLIKNGDVIAEVIIKSVDKQSIEIKPDDIFVIAQKIISKAEGRIVNLKEVFPSKYSANISKSVNKDPRFIEFVLRESKRVVRIRENTLIVEHKKGFICANAGIDHSNVNGDGKEESESYLLLPVNPDKSAEVIRKTLEKYFNMRIGILVIDSHGRAWRNGIMGSSIGVSGIPSLVDLRGEEDLFGFHLKITTVGAADELAAGASLLMGQAKEGTPIIHVRGFPYNLRDSSLKELIRSKETDLFR